MTANHKRQLTAILLGLAFTFLLAEVAVRIAGSLHFSEPNIENRKGREFRIACLGNSHTHGYGVPKGTAYPEVLQKFFEEERPEFKVSVVNHGIGNANTYVVLKHLEKVLKAEKPDIVMVMAGEPNFWSKEGFESFLIEKEGYVPGATSPVLNFLSHSRLFRWIFMLQYERRLKNISEEAERERTVYWDFGKNFLLLTPPGFSPELRDEAKKNLEEYIALKKGENIPAIREMLVMLARMEWYFYQNYQKAINHLEESFRLYPIPENPLTAVTALTLFEDVKDRQAKKRLLEMVSRFSHFKNEDDVLKVIRVFGGIFDFDKGPKQIEELERLRKLVPASPHLHMHLADYYYKNGQISEALDVATELVRANPLQLLASDIYSYFTLEKMATYPEKLQAQAMKVREEFLARFPTEAYRLEGSGEKRVGEWIQWDLGKMISATRAAGSTIILQGYHWLRPGYAFKEELGQSILKAAEENQARYLDQAKIFESQIDGDEATFYISQLGLPSWDNHPSVKGHRLIARIMYDYLNQNGLLPEELRNLGAWKLYRYKHEAK